MPNSHVIISAPLREALFECFRAAARLKTEDVDVAAPSWVLIDIWEGVKAGVSGFSIEPDGKIAFDAPQGFRVLIDFIEIGGGCIEQIHVTEPFFEGSVASELDLLRLRAVTVVDRGSDGEDDDFRWLLSKVARLGQLLPALTYEELDYVRKAGESCLGSLDRLVLAAVMGGDNMPAALQLFKDSSPRNKNTGKPWGLEFALGYE